MKPENPLLLVIKDINRYLTRQFIADPDGLPDNECENEAQMVFAKVTKYWNDPCTEHPLKSDRIYGCSLVKRGEHFYFQYRLICFKCREEGGLE